MTTSLSLWCVSRLFLADGGKFYDCCVKVGQKMKPRSEILKMLWVAKSLLGLSVDVVDLFHLRLLLIRVPRNFDKHKFFGRIVSVFRLTMSSLFWMC